MVLEGAGNSQRLQEPFRPGLLAAGTGPGSRARPGKNEKKIENVRPLMSEPSLRLFTYLENFNRLETFRKSLSHTRDHENRNQSQNELWKFQRELKLYRNFLLNCAEALLTDVRGGELCGAAR